MGFYDTIAKDIPWEIGIGTESYYKVVNGKLQLPSIKWLQYHLNELDNVIDSINAFKKGILVSQTYDVSKIVKHIINDPEEAINFLEDLDKNYNEFSIDIETNNLSTDKTKNKILCIGIAYKDDEGVSFTKECFLNPKFRVKFQLFCSLNTNLFILHNGTFDKSRTKILEDIDLKIDEDTLLMHYCGINEHKGTHGLKDLAQLYLGFPDWEKVLDDYKHTYCRAHKIKLTDFQYEYFPQDMLAKYNVIDCCATFQLKKVFEKIMTEMGKPIYRKLVEASKYYANMIARGMLLNNTYWESLRDELENEKDQLEKELKVLVPNVLITSPQQLLRWLRKEFPYDGIDSTDKYTIETLAMKYPDKEALHKILDYRKNVKYLKTYVYGLWDKRDYENIIHCEFNLFGTETGRLSSSKPNMQNIPRADKIKKLFISREGYKFIQLDYSQSELRVLAYISGDENLMQCYIDGRDLHGEIQKKLFKDEYDPHNKDQRTIAKTINFGIPYGRTAQGIAQKLRIPLSDAKKYLDDWFKASPKVVEYMENHRKMALAEPQELYYTPFGRTRHYFITSATLNHVRNQSINFPISSTANDLTIYSLCEIGKWLEEKGFDAYLVNTVHDSIVIEVREKDAEVIAKKCQEIMASIPQRYLPNVTLPFKADVDTGFCWGDMNEPDWYGDDDE